jgi:hypothetical protein
MAKFSFERSVVLVDPKRAKPRRQVSTIGLTPFFKIMARDVMFDYHKTYRLGGGSARSHF